MLEMVDLRPLLGSAGVRDLLDHMDYPPPARQAKTAAVIRECRDHPEQPVWGAVRCGSLLGFIWLRIEGPGSAVVRQIAVHGSHRRQGIGRHMIQWAWRTHGLRALSAETDRHAVAFYRGLGFAAGSLGEKYPGTERFHCTLIHPAWASPTESPPAAASGGQTTTTQAESTDARYQVRQAAASDLPE
mgnify:CR=1 FL=1